MNKQKTFLIIILILLLGNVFLGVKYFSTIKELRQKEALLETQKTNGQVVEFTKLFIEKVLKSKTEVDFEMRLQLENAVRDIGDEQILAQWSKFIESKTESDAQEEVKNLLEILLRKIRVE